MYTGPNAENDGLVFGYDADDRSTRFYKGEPTTNLIPGTSNPSLSTNGWGQTGWVGSVTIDTNENALVLTATNGWHDMNYDFGVLNQPITVSFQYKFKSQQTNNYGYVLNGTNLGSYAIYLNNITPTLTEYKTYTTTFTPTTSSKIVIGLRGLDNSGLTDVMYIKNLQVEQKSHKTQYTSTTRTNTNSLIDFKKTTSIDLSNVSFDSTAHPIWDGVDDRIIVSNTILSSPISLTVESVFMRTGLFPGIIGVVMHRNDETNPNVGNSEFVICSYKDDNYVIYGTIGANTNTAVWNTGRTGIVCELNKYYHVVSTWDGTLVKTYVNGVLCVTYPLTTYTNSGGRINFGTSTSNGTVYQFVGKIPINRIYKNKIFTQEDVNQNFNSYKNRFNI